MLKNEHEVHDGNGKAPAKMQAKCTIIRNGRRDMLKHARNERTMRISPPREERADIEKRIV